MGLSVSFYTVGDVTFASSRTRVFQFLPFLHKDGVRTTVFTDDRMYSQASPLRPLERRWHRFSNRLGFLISALFHDVVFVQKIVFPRWYVNLLVFLNPRLLFDLDDAIYTNSGSEHIDTRNLDYLLSLAKGVSSENEEILDYVRRFNTNVVNILGPIDCSRYRPRQTRPHDGPVTIGWVGSPSTEKYLFLIREAFALLDPGSYRFVCIGVRPTFAERWGLPVETVPWTIDTEVASLDEFDLGIMPLPDDLWSRGKGGYKLLQYMAMGIPSVTSPIGVNTELVEDAKTGFLAPTINDWVNAFKTLLSSAEDRQKMGTEARRRAVERYSFEHYYPVYKRLLDEALIGDKGKP